MNRSLGEPDWLLELDIRGRLSVRSAQLVTRAPITLIGGRNGVGKSQLLAIIHSYFNSDSDQYLKDQGHRTYFPKGAAFINIQGPERIHYVSSTRIIARGSEERTRGAYSFEELSLAHPGGRFH